ncbi:MAG: IS1634 family transposase [Bacteroidales bacterium]|nr:IS1634 family transposase [Bacteroidales bacterium]
MLERAVKGLTLVGPDLIYGRLFDKIGYNKVQTKDNELFKSLVVTRLYKPGSKLRTLEYLSYFMNEFFEQHQVYRFLDNLCYRKEKEMSEEEREAAERESVKYQVEQITYEQTKSVLGGAVSVVFYDTTTMYFEAREDDFRVTGWSKDGKNSNPQIVLGLLVAPGGNPIGYEIHKGNQYEGDTLIPIIRKLQKRFGFGKPVVIADAGLLNSRNISALEADGYEYILGARIKSQTEAMKDRILSLCLGNGESGSIPLTPGRRMVITMSGSRAQKNAADREKGIKRLEKRFRTQALTKDKINNRGYNRFLTLEGDATVRIDYSKVEYDARFDGLKGYVTNCHMSDNEIVENYKYLFLIERAMRFNKTDLDIRPIYHRLYNRIKAHICICFVAYTIMLELERILKAAGDRISLKRAMFLSERIYQLNYVNPFDRKKMSFILDSENSDEVNELLQLIADACDKEK